MSGAKNFLASKTIWGIFIMLLPTILSVFGIPLTTEGAKEIAEALEPLVAALGAVLAVVGRVTAKSALRLA